MGERAMRPFWIHQAAEYLIGLVLVAMGLQSLDPFVPTLAGGLVILNAAVVDGPLGAFRLFSRRAHRVADLVVIAVLAVLAVLPWIDLENSNRILLAVCAVILGFVWWNSAFERRPARQALRAQEEQLPVGKLTHRTHRGPGERELAGLQLDDGEAA